MPKRRAKSGIGIEIRDDRINLAKLAQGPNGVVLVGARSIKLPLGNKEDDKKLLAANIIKIFEGLASAKDEISLGVGGQISFVRKVKLPPVSYSKLKQVISFEVQQQVPFSLNEVIWDYQVVSPVSKVPGPVIVLMAAIKQSFVEDLLKVLQNSINKIPDVVDTSSLALHNCLVFNDLLPKEKVGILVNFGFSYTDVSIENKGEMAFTRAVPIGKKNILKKIAESKGVDIEKAEEILEKYARSDVTSEAGVKDISPLILSVWEDLVAEIKRTTNYYLSQVEKVTHFQYIYISGEFPQDVNLINLLQNSFRVEVKEINPFNKIAYDPAKLTDSASNFCVVTGLALRALKHFSIEINLLPPKLLSKRQLADKRLYFISSFVMIFLIGWIILVLGTRSYNLTKEKIDMIEPILKNYKPYVSKAEELKNERQQIISKFQNIEVILKQKSQLSKILLEISKLTPSSISITEITTGALETGRETTGVRGAVRTNPSEDRRVPAMNTEGNSKGVPIDPRTMPTGGKNPNTGTPLPEGNGNILLTDKISLSGTTASYPTVDEYINKLKTSPLFKTVGITSVVSTSDSSGGRSATTEGIRGPVKGARGTTSAAEATVDKEEEVKFTLEIVIGK